MRTKLPMKLSENHPHKRYTVGGERFIIIVLQIVTMFNNVVSIQDSFIDLLLFLGDETMILYFETNEIGDFFTIGKWPPLPPPLVRCFFAR